MKRFLVAVTAILMMATMADAACSSAIANRAKQLMLQGYFKQADTMKMAFYTDTATFGSTTTQYTATNEVTGTNYSAGGYSLTSFTTGTATTTSWWDFADVSQSTVTFNSASTCALVYDSTTHASECTGSGAPYACCTGNGAGCAGDVVAFVLSFTSIQPSAGTLTVTWPTADASNAIVRIQ